MQHAKARFSELLDACQREGPKVVSELREQVAAKAGEIKPWLDQVCDTFSIL